MATSSVNVIIKGRDKASHAFTKVDRSLVALKRTINRTAAAALGFLGVRQLLRFGSESVDLFRRQEAAVNSLGAALSLVGPKAKTQVGDFQKFASSIQQITTFGDEAILEMTALGASIAGLSGDVLKQATIAAIGLSKAFGIDAVAAMRLVARAAVGDTASLKRYGIVLEDGLSTQEKFNRVLAIGVEKFSLATEETKTLDGRMKQLSNTWGDYKEVIGGFLAQKSVALLDWFKNMSAATIHSSLSIIKWTGGLAATFALTPKIISLGKVIVSVFRSIAAATTITQALSGPAGIASIVVGLGVAIGTVTLLDNAFDKLESSVAETRNEFSLASDDINKLVGSTGQAVTDLSNIDLGGSVNAANGSNGLSLKDKVLESVHALELERRELSWLAKTANRTADEVLQLKAAAAGFDMIDQEDIKALIDWRDQTKATLVLQEALQATAKDLKREIATFGFSPEKIELFDLKNLGATQEQLDEIKRLRDELDRLRKPETDPKDKNKDKSFKFLAGGNPKPAFRNDRFLTRQRGSGVDSTRQIVTLNQARNNQLTLANRLGEQTVALLEDVRRQLQNLNNQQPVSIS